MSQFMLIAGPQAAGKSTVIASLNERYTNNTLPSQSGKPTRLFTLQESRQIIVHKYMLLGAIFMTKEHEMEVVESDLRRMDKILERDGSDSIYVDECNIFTIAHGIAHGIVEIGGFWEEYIKRLEKLRARVLFLDVPPEISWERRCEKYEQRLVLFPENDQPVIMKRYREYMESLNFLLKEIYHRLPFQKEMIDGCLPTKEVLRQVTETLINGPTLL